METMRDLCASQREDAQRLEEVTIDLVFVRAEAGLLPLWNVAERVRARLELSTLRRTQRHLQKRYDQRQDAILERVYVRHTVRREPDSVALSCSCGSAPASRGDNATVELAHMRAHLINETGGHTDADGVYVGMWIDDELVMPGDISC